VQRLAEASGNTLAEAHCSGFYLSHFFLSDVITLSCLFSQPVQALAITQYMSEGKNIKPKEGEIRLNNLVKKR
jgi:hypothetical protein